MNKETFAILAGDASKALKQHRLGDALNALEGMRACVGAPLAAGDFDDVAGNYTLMLDYMRQGVADAERHKLFRTFLQQACRAYSALSRAFDLKVGMTTYATTAATVVKLQEPKTLSDLCHQRATVSGRMLFDVVWTSDLWRESDFVAAEELMAAGDVLWENKCLLLSASMLGALHYFDVYKLKFLQNAVMCESPVLKARALTGAVLVSLSWPEYYELWPELNDQWRVMCDDAHILSGLSTLQAQLALSMETKRIEHKMQKEILPEMLRRSEHLKKIKGPEGLTFDALKNEMEKMTDNPEWEATRDSLSDKMKALMDMQQKGADVFIGSFKMLKQNFPFFSVAANWFYPFTLKHPDMPEQVRKDPFVTLLLTGQHLCESDKYSFCLMWAQMRATSGASTEMAMSQLSGMFGDTELTSASSSKPPSLHSCIHSYVLDLYRYFKLYRNREDRTDPFRHDLLLVHLDTFRRIFHEFRDLRELADFTFSVESYPWALELYHLLEPTAEILQKMGYCHQVHGDYGAALDTYERANLMRGGSVWTLRQMAVCNLRLGMPEKALLCYEELGRLVPDDVDILLRHGECFIRTSDYKAALRLLYKAYYLSPDNPVAMRAIAWCCLQTEQNEQAESFYRKLLSGSPLAADWLNAGHTAWVSGRLSEAVGRYRKYWNLTAVQDGDKGMFDEDLDFLKSRGITLDDVRIMTDAVCGESTVL